MSREAMQMALEALELYQSKSSVQMFDIAVRALRQALKTEQEPVAWRYALDASVEGPRWIYIDKDPHQWLQGPAMVNAAIEELHTSPQPSKPWVGLTDEEIKSVCYKRDWTAHWTDTTFARAIEAKLREKNNG